MDSVVNWFILIFIFVFDPFAIILLISANKAFDIVRGQIKENIYGETVEVKDDWDEAEKRMDIIGQNGNDGLHYDDNDPPKPSKTIKIS